MPSASPEDRALATEYWGDIGPEGPCAFLESLGYTFRKDGSYSWDKPTPNHVLSRKERFAINYLVWEWDYGGLNEQTKPN